VAVLGDGERLDVLRRSVDGLARATLNDHGVDAHRRPIGVREHVHGPAVG
jgi:hypothetical protein